MRNVETFLAAAGLIVCLALLVRMVLGAPARQRLDSAARRIWERTRRGILGVWYAATQWRRGRNARMSAAEVAEEAIRRAKGQPAGVKREGNVYKPDSFKGPRKPH